MRLIDADALIEEIDGDLSDSIAEGIAIEKIMNAPTIEPEWVPVGERLPKDYEPVLVWYEYFRYGDYNCMFKTYGIGVYHKNFWTGDVNGHKARALAWMPLPEPYKGGKQDG